MIEEEATQYTILWNTKDNKNPLTGKQKRQKHQA